jgi:hypothetical protein
MRIDQREYYALCESRWWEGEDEKLVLRLQAYPECLIVPRDVHAELLKKHHPDIDFEKVDPDFVSDQYESFDNWAKWYEAMPLKARKHLVVSTSRMQAESILRFLKEDCKDDLVISPGAIGYITEMGMWLIENHRALHGDLARAVEYTESLAAYIEGLRQRLG